MPLDERLQALVSQFDKISRMNRAELPMAEIRQQANVGLASIFRDYAESVPDAPREVDLSVGGPAGSFPIRLYLPENTQQPLPVHLYLHGGSWWAGDLIFGNDFCRRLVHRLGTAAISVGYHLAPEYRFPLAIAECCWLFEWLQLHGREYGLDASCVSIGGTSAGANIAAATVLRLKETRQALPCGQLLECPALDASMSSDSMRSYGEGFLLSRSAIEEGWGHYLDTQDRANPLASPLAYPDLSGLPASLIITAECDPLRDEGERYAQRLKAAGVDVKLQRFAGMIHGFAGLTKLLPQARECQQLMESTLELWYGQCRDKHSAGQR